MMHRPNPHTKVALISMPWMSAHIPSIQLATLQRSLAGNGIEADCFEYFLDYAERVGLHLYDMLSNAGGFIEEYVFARHYYREECGDPLASFKAVQPRFGMPSREYEDIVLEALVPVTDQFLAELVEGEDWTQYDVVGFTLTIYQTAASMALARLLKQRHPTLLIVFGGSSCAGPMGSALLKVCPYVDVVVRVEGEVVFPELVERLVAGKDFSDLDGISWRADAAEGTIRSTPPGPVYAETELRPPLRFDHYFHRLEALGIRDRVNPWIPFESSRGCWYGEKNQCRFCGLHEIMKYRSSGWESTLHDLEHLHERYGVPRFFSVDLILPQEYYHTLLPELARKDGDWTLFYEIKANVKRWQVEALAAAGVRWIQPGIESLHTDVLKLMHKGVSALQNIQLLVWCKEFDIRVTWNIIVGIPGEEPDWYAAMAAQMRTLYHLFPPSGAFEFQLHRFSPYFDRPDEFGVSPLGAHPLYRHIFPEPDEVLNDLAYRYAYDIAGQAKVEEYAGPVREAIREWQLAHRRGATLELVTGADGGSTIIDTRHTTEPRTHWLSAEQTRLYRFLHSARLERDCWEQFVAADGSRPGVGLEPSQASQFLRDWANQGLIIRADGRLLAVASDPAHEAKRRTGLAARKLTSPVPYLALNT